MTWAKNLKRIRRMLRDPAGNIWSDATLLALWNDVQREFQVKTNCLGDVRSVRVPPAYDCAYLHDCEWGYLPSGTGNYRALRYHEPSDSVYCHRWEPQAAWGLVSATATDDGTHFSQPWEAWHCSPPGDVVPLPLPLGFHNALLVAWDREPIDYLTRKGITTDDPSWATRTGTPQGYWRPDQLEDQFCLYPLPSTVVWSDIQGAPPAEPVYIYAFDWEEDEEYLAGTGANWSREDETNTRQYLHDWEGDIGTGRDRAATAGMWGYELGTGTTAPGDGILRYTEDEASGDYGVLVDNGNDILHAEAISPDDNVLFVYAKTATALASPGDESDFPSFLQKYLEAGVLERAYGADTDGRIPSLRDYWAERKELGLKAVRRFLSNRRADRDYRLTTKGAPGFRTRRQPRLPDAYPAVW